MVLKVWSWASNICITQAFVRNANSEAASQTC